MDSLNKPPFSQPEPPPMAGPAGPPVGVAPSSEPTVALSPSPSPTSQPAPVPARKVGSSFGSDLIGSLQSLMGTVVIAIFVITFITQAFQIPSGSMENTLLVGDYLLVNKLCYGGSGLGDHLMPYQRIERGDIVVFHYPVDPTQ